MQNGGLWYTHVEAQSQDTCVSSISRHWETVSRSCSCSFKSVARRENMFTKKLALALCVGAVVLLATAGANATITVTPITAAATYDLTGADDYWVVGTQAEGGNGLLALSFAYTTTINWNYGGPGSPWQPSPETVTLTNPGDSNN